MRTQKRQKLIFSWLLLLVVLLVPAVTVQTQNGDSCDIDGVKVGFQGTVCGIGPFHVNLNGVSATGSNTKCLNVVGGNFTFTSTNKAFVKLKLDQTYVVESGTGICVNEINFDVPPGYVMYIDGIESTSILKTDGGVSPSGDGSWNVVIRKKCPCGDDQAGQAGPKAGSVIWQAGVGKLSDGRSAERLSVREKTLSAAIYTPSALIYSPPANTSEVDVVTTGNILRQIKAPQALADIVVINSSEYDIRYYRPADVGAKTSVYAVSGQPFVTWKFKNTNPGTFTKLQIQKYENGNPLPSDISEYTWEPLTNTWTLRTGWTGAAYTRIETIFVSYPTPTSRTETFIVKEGDGTVVSVLAKTYQTFAWGEELVQEVQDPDKAALTTTYTYYQNASEDHRYQKLLSVTFPDGSWEKYDYDVFFNISTIMRPWKDLSLETATPANSHLTIYGYTNSDNGVFGISTFPKIDFDTEVKIGGVTVSKTRLNRSIPSVDPEPLIATAEESYKSANAGVPVDLVKQTITTRYHHSASPFLAERVESIVYPDGRKDSFTYEKGNYVPNADPALAQFVPDANGLAQRQTLIHGSTTHPEGVAFKTTKETFVLDQFGNDVLVETYAYNGTAYERIEWLVNSYDDRGHLLTTRDHKRQLVTAVWTNDKKTSDIDASGVETTYTYDPLGRLKTRTKKGIAAGGGFPAQSDIVTTFFYDATGQPTGETTAGSGLSLSTEIQYDQAGRLIREKDQAGLITNYAYTNGGRTVTVTRPGGATIVNDKYLDGQQKSSTGSAVVARNFNYGVNADGTQYRQEFIGNAGLSSPRWTKTTTDWVGRLVSVEKPSFTGTNVIETSFYNALNQLEKRTAMAGTAKLMADELFEYDELGREIRAGSDIDNSGTLAIISTDRVSETDVSYEKVGSDWFKLATSRIYLTDNDNTPVQETQRERLTSFPLNGTDQTVSDVTISDVAGNSTRTTTTIDRAAKKQTTTTDTPDSNMNAVSISVNRLLQSSTATTPQSATTYTYDTLGRQLSMTHPRNGTTSQTFASSGRVATTFDGSGTTTYEYYPDGHVNAGRLKSLLNAANKKVYFVYNSLGELTQTWGDTTYPMEFVYDSYGQRTELHTFRAGQNWSASVWPAATAGTADVTTWTYQESTGLITQKLDAALKGTSFTYDELGRVKTRVWARGITCTYGYDAITGELRTVTYSDSTPGVSFSYDRGGRQTSATDVGGARTRTFNAAGQLETEQITGGVLDGINIAIGYDGFLRRNSLQTTRGANTLSNQSYGYDATSRLSTVTSGSQTATYAYHTNSGLLNTTTFTGGTSIARSYDAQGRLENITDTPAAALAQSYAYTLNNLNQRTRLTREDGSYWSYLYNDRGELTSGKKYWSDNALVLGAQAEYNFDNIGNRKYARNGGNPLGSLRQSNYSGNSLNQNSQRTVPGAVDVVGLADTNATVTVNNQATARKGEYFYRELALTNTTSPVSQQVNVVGARNNFGPGGEDAVTEKGGRVVLPASSETFVHDDDGNLTTDGLWSYTWDGNNRLTSMQSTVAVPAEAKRKLDFVYDYAGRRILKNVSTWNVNTSAYQLQSTTKFVYDGWNVHAELDGNNVLTRSYVWGSDVSGSSGGAAGIGGLLLINEGGEGYQAGYDGNGNVGLLVKTSDGSVAASYEYDGVGNLLKATGDYASRNPFRFSTKYIDTETGLVYYGQRYVNQQTGKWLSRDPLAEKGSSNLYLYNDNDAVNLVDPIGLQQNPYTDDWLGRVADAFKFKHYVESSPNWDFAAHTMYHSFHTMTLRVCMPAKEAIDKAYAGLKKFDYFEPNLASVSVSGDRGHFNLSWWEFFSKVGSATPLIGNSIDVVFHNSDATSELFAVTIGSHPLVGVRKWWATENPRNHSRKEVLLVISTEAYEQSNGLVVNALGRWWPVDGGHLKQSSMWSSYLRNIADAWKKNHNARLEESPTPVVEATNLTYNPYRGLLPPSLRESQYYYDYSPF